MPRKKLFLIPRYHYLVVIGLLGTYDRTISNSYGKGAFDALS